MQFKKVRTKTNTTQYSSITTKRTRTLTRRRAWRQEPDKYWDQEVAVWKPWHFWPREHSRGADWANEQSEEKRSDTVEDNFWRQGHRNENQTHEFYRVGNRRAERIWAVFHCEESWMQGQDQQRCAEQKEVASWGLKDAWNTGAYFEDRTRKGSSDRK